MQISNAGEIERKIVMAFDSVGIGKRIKQCRSEKQLSQEELGDIIGVTRKHLSKIELGDRAPTLDLLILIANALDVSADDLLLDNLKHTSSLVGTEIHAILQSCNNDEKEILTRLLKFMKNLFMEFNI